MQNTLLNPEKDLKSSPESTSIKMQVERWNEISREEMDCLFPVHWEEIALNKDKIPLKVDYERYDTLDKAGMLCIVTVRDAGRLIGYHCCFLATHPHYKDTLMAYTDVYFLLDEYRKEDFTLGLRLFREMEKVLRDRGVKNYIVNTKLKRDNSPIFKRLGFTETERVWTKYIGD